MFQQNAAPPRPRPGPPSPSPCSVCGACLQWQRIPCTIQGAAPMIRLQRSTLLLRSCYRLETQHLLPQLSSCASFLLRSQVHLESQAPPRSLALKGSGGAGGGGGEWHHRLLTRVSTWRVRTGLSVSCPASARHTAPLISSSSNSRSGRSKARRVIIGPGQSTGVPGQAVWVHATRSGSLTPGQTGMGGLQGASSSSCCCSPPSTLSPPPRGGRGCRIPYPVIEVADCDPSANSLSVP